MPTSSLEQLRSRINTCLQEAIATEGSSITPVSVELVDAMQYALSNGGKRIRPLLVYASTIAAGGRLTLADAPAVAIEMIHAYSLIHDDLPAMDDDDLRRGIPSCHIQFGEAMAILAGDGLQAIAFHRLVKAFTDNNHPHGYAVFEHIAAAAKAMVAGQALDISSVNKQLDEATLRTMHRNKTGALIRASIVVGSLCSTQIDNDDQALFSEIGELIGVAFQIYDDLLDLEIESAQLGKPKGSDIEKNKPTYPAVMGVTESKRLGRELHDQALEKINQLSGDSTLLASLCGLLANRTS